MKHKTLGISLATTLMMAAASVTAFADLDAASVVSSFNGMNGTGQGYRFTYRADGSLVYVTAQDGGYARADTSAYVGGTYGSNYFTTFCVEPTVSITNPAMGKLNYNASNGETRNSSGVALTFGAAYLYKQYATGAISVTSATSGAFTAALQVLMGTQTLTNWLGNTFLSGLQAANSDKSYWTKIYDTRKEYSEIGQYSVFVMQVTNVNGGGDYQDFLYIAKTSGGSSVVPEPASILLWSLGGLGLAGSWARKRRMKKLALS